MRLFVALLPPKDVLAEIAEVFGPYRRQWTDLRWVPEDQWHVTLAFLGEVDDELLGPLERRLERAVARYEPVSVAFAGAGAFPSASRARVFWAGLDEGPDGRAPLWRLADSLVAAARRAGLEGEDRKRFHAHLTLARSRPEADLRPLVEMTRSFAGRRWEAAAVHLVRSHPGPPVTYEPLVSWPLG